MKITNIEVSKYLENLVPEGITLRKKVNQKYKEFLAISKATQYLHMDKLEIDGYKIIKDKTNNEYTLVKGRRSVNFQRMSDILEGKYNLLTKEQDIRILTDEEYDLIEYYLDEKDLLRKVKRRNSCHELTYKYAKQYNMRAVTGLIIPNYDEVEIFHSWLENDDICFDITNDIVMNKETFYEFVEEKLIELSIEELEEIEEEINDYYSLLYLAASEKLKRKCLTNK